MKILTLQVKKQQFDKLVDGTHKIERRIITPATQSKFLIITSNEVTIKLYDVIRFVEGNHKNSPEVYVKIEKTDLEYEPDEDGYIKLEETDDGRLVILDSTMIFTLGDILDKSVVEI